MISDVFMLGKFNGLEFVDKVCEIDLFVLIFLIFGYVNEVDINYLFL